MTWFNKFCDSSMCTRIEQEDPKKCVCRIVLQRIHCPTLHKQVTVETLDKIRLLTTEGNTDAPMFVVKE